MLSASSATKEFRRFAVHIKTEQNARGITRPCTLHSLWSSSIGGAHGWSGHEPFRGLGAESFICIRSFSTHRLPVETGSIEACTRSREKLGKPQSRQNLINLMMMRHSQISSTCKQCHATRNSNVNAPLFAFRKLLVTSRLSVELECSVAG